jgi:haloacid dehalogenase superfamily, subfamily IA, variant 3 with third motif having DD or ED/haloacid dehalogenase superfamily, subfamily IA, variant 1 with third motif having Dx(3-4)D or Dx(3-4)E
MDYAARLLVFDLDGTLVDSKEDIANAVNVALESFDLPPLPNPVIYSYVGDGASALILRALPPEKADLLPEVLDRFLAYYQRHLLDTTRAYPGVVEALRKWAGIYRMAVLTNKGVAMTQEILSGLSLDGYFFEVRGGDSFGTKKPDPEGLLHILREAGVDAQEAIMVGDSRNDVLAGKAAGALTCGVTYGLGASGFADHSPDFTVDRFPDLFFRIRPV